MLRPRMVLNENILRLWADNPKLVQIDPQARRFFSHACEALIEELRRSGKEWILIEEPLQYQISA